MLRRLGWITCFCLFASVSIFGCDCGTVATTCSEDKDCQGRLCESTRCACQEGSCKPVQCLKDHHCEVGQQCKDYKCTTKDPDTTCKTDADCPEGKCNTETGKCENTCNVTGCTGGKVCCDLDNGKGLRCNFKRCNKNDDCRTGSKNTCVEPLKCDHGIESTCVQGECKCEMPCGGGECGSGKCCDIKKNACVENPKPCPSLTCPPGTDPPEASKFKVDPKTCELTGPKCECVKRPPLKEGEMGLHSEIGLWNGRPVVSAYNETYGDLVVGFQQPDNSIKWEFVDGIPAGAKPTGAVDGPRGGISDPGDDVGKYTSIVVANQVVHVSYFDATKGQLKYARKDADKWKSHVVDDKGKLVGRYTSITSLNGSPVIAYFVVNDGTGKTVLRVATAKTPTPNSAADWDVTPLETRPLLSCLGSCDSKKKEVCVSVSGKPTCKVPGSGCPKACSKDQACINKQCVKVLSNVANPPLPDGAGLFPSIAALPSGGLVVVYYDKTNGDLRMAQSQSGKFVMKALKTQGDVGQFPSVAVSTNGDLHISYINNDTADVHYLKLDKSFKEVSSQIVDQGLVKDEDRRLADTSIAVDSSGAPRIVYQDASVQSLKTAIIKSGKWEVKKIAGEDNPYLGAFGFFVDIIVRNGTAYISNYKYNLREPKGKGGIDIRTLP